MGDNSEKFFNTVTTDPATASSVTTGELHDQGPQALAERYSGIAYFEVKKITIDQQRAVVHADPNNPDDSTGLTGSNKVLLTATAFDVDGDHAAAPLDRSGVRPVGEDGHANGVKRCAQAT
jgi:hypothetical protein